MLRAVIITIFPLAFLIILFGGGALFLRRNIDMDGTAPINRTLFYTCKYSIFLIWLPAILHSCGINFAIISVPEALTWTALCLWILGFTLLIAGRLNLGDSFRIGTPKESTKMKVNGLFKLSRNPMYLALYTTFLAAVLFTLNPIILLLAIFVVIVHHRIVLAEERHMHQVFGEEYDSYCMHVRRYI